MRPAITRMGNIIMKKKITFISDTHNKHKHLTSKGMGNILEQWNIWDEKDFRYTDFIYTFKNGSYIELFGLEGSERT